MLVLARGTTAAIVFAVLALAGAGAMPAPAEGAPDQFEERWGDLDCSGEIQVRDALSVLKHVAGRYILIPEGICWDKRFGIFPDTLLRIEGGAQVQWADVDCSGEITAVDALLLLREVVRLPAKVFAGCPQVGAITTLSFAQ
jgi:hypothetical protein